MTPRISVVVPTRNRPEQLAATLKCLMRQSLGSERYEIIVVDDGSTPPVRLPTDNGEVHCSLVRLEGVERSAARNAGAAAARGELLVFVDDDLSMAVGFLAAHLRAHTTWPDALLVGAIRLPEDWLKSPYGRFRQKLEDSVKPAEAGLVLSPNICAAGNMAIHRARFDELGGFDLGMSCGEDQDLALRHTARGGRIAFVPDAAVMHHDSATDIRSYCRRTEWGSEHMLPFCRRYPRLAENRERDRVNGPARWGKEPLTASVRKGIKALLATRLAVAALFRISSILERCGPNGKALHRIYRLLLGAHILRGYRKGLKRFGTLGDAKREIQPLADRESGMVPC